MLIETKGPRLPVNTFVEISFPVDRRITKRPHQVRAIVLHSGPHGAGLMFDELDDDLHAALRDLMVGQRGQTRTESTSKSTSSRFHSGRI